MRPFPVVDTAWKYSHPIQPVLFALLGRVFARLRNLSRWFPRAELLSPTSFWQAFAVSAPSTRGLGGKFPARKPPNEVGLPLKSRIKGVPNQARLFLLENITLRFV
jgi:hypothetical protein